MRVVGGFYVVLGLGFLPPVNEARFEVFLPAFDAPQDSVAFRALIDWTFVFGLDTAVLGGMLLWASRRPVRHLVLVWTVVALELTRGAGWDFYYLLRGYTPSVGFYTVFIVVHLVIAASGVLLARRAQGHAALP